MRSETYHGRQHSEGARAHLLTLLGEYVHPAGEPVWTRTFIAALAALGFHEGTARQTLSRAAERGWLRSRRIGRETRWSLSDSTRRVIEAGTARIYGLGREQQRWRRKWLLLHVEPGSDRASKRRLRTRLEWAGYGRLGPGTWIAPDSGRQPHTRRALAELGVDREAVVLIGRIATDDDPRELAARAWHLGELRELYREILDEMRRHRPGAPRSSFVALTRLVHCWRTMPFVDPDLPAELLPDRWIGHRAAERFHTLHARWSPAAQAYWRELSGGR